MDANRDRKQDRAYTDTAIGTLNVTRAVAAAAQEYRQAEQNERTVATQARNEDAHLWTIGPRICLCLDLLCHGPCSLCLYPDLCRPGAGLCLDLCLFRRLCRSLDYLLYPFLALLRRRHLKADEYEMKCLPVLIISYLKVGYVSKHLYLLLHVRICS